MKKLFFIFLIAPLGLMAMIDVDDDLDEIVETVKKEQAPQLKTNVTLHFPKRQPPTTPEERQKDDILTFFEKTLAPLAERLGNLTQSPEAKKAIDEQTKERSRKMKEMQNRIKNQRSTSSHSYSPGYSGGYPSRGRSSYSSSSSPYSSYSPHGGYSPSSYQPSYGQSSSFQPPSEQDKDLKSTPHEPTKEKAGPHFYNEKEDKDEKKEKKEKLKKEEEDKKTAENLKKAKVETTRLKDTFVKTMADITKLHKDLPQTHLLSKTSELNKLYDAYSQSLATLPKEEQVKIGIDADTLSSILPHIIYGAAHDILDDKTETTKNSISCKVLLDKLVKEPSLAQTPAYITGAYEEAYESIKKQKDLKGLDLQAAAQKELADKLQRVVDRLGASNLPQLVRALPKPQPSAQPQAQPAQVPPQQQAGPQP